MADKKITQHDKDNLEMRGLDKCIACASCVAMCPVSRATADFLGPKLTGPALERFRLSDLPETKWLEYCSNCKTCDITCPFGVPVSLLNMSARAEYCKTHKPPLRDWILGHGRTLSKLVEFFPNFLVKFGMLNPVTRWILDCFGIDKRAPMPVFAKSYFPSLLKKTKQPHGKKVILFSGCYVDVYDPVSGLDLVKLLNEAGYEVIRPQGLDCCGLPMVANGFLDDAAASAAKNYERLKKYNDEGVPVISPCPTCCLMLSQEYEEFFPDITKDGRLSVINAAEFVEGLILHGEFDGTFESPEKMAVIYHEPCHLKAQGIGKTGLRLLKMIKNITVQDAAAGCCGISGSYGFKKGKYDISMSIGAELFKKVKESGAALASSECGTCRVQIAHGTGRETVHPVSIMRRFYIGKK